MASAETELVRAIARALLDYADSKDAADSEASVSEGNLPPVSGTATSQRAVLAALAAGNTELTAREIADRTDVTQFNVYEKLDRLKDMGYVEHVPGSNPKRWRLTPEAAGLPHGDGTTQLNVPPSVSRASVEEIRDAISWCLDTEGERSGFTGAMESRGNLLADWAREGYPGLKTWSGRQPPPKPQIADYLRQALVTTQSGDFSEWPTLGTP
jgi:DNA-binding MarR family transcriptional regulator